MLPVWGAYALGVTPFWLGLIAIAACVGHIWPVFFGFKGGKGVATAFGAIAPIGWDLTGVMAGTATDHSAERLLIIGRHRQRADRAILCLVVQTAVYLPVSMLSCLILLRHHDNIQRLWRRRDQNLVEAQEKEKDAP